MESQYLEEKELSIPKLKEEAKVAEGMEKYLKENSYLYKIK